MKPDFIQHEMSTTEIASLIAVEVEGGQLGLADALRTSVWYCLEIDPTVTGKRFADSAALIGLHHQGARNRYSEARRQLVEMGQIAATTN